MRATRVTIAAVVVLLAATNSAAGQGGDANSFRLSATRQALASRADSLEAAAQSGTLKKEAQTLAASEAASIRARLARGDFMVGDRILLTVEGEKELSDTFTVGPGAQLTLPLIGDVPLEGVLRSELQEYLSRRLAQNLRDPEVRTRAFIRLSIQGAVAKPGYYGVPADALLSDALTTAGGTTQDAKIDQMRIDRDSKPLLIGRALQQAIAQGRTLDDAGLVAGDQFIVPKRGGSTTKEVITFSAFLLTIPITIYTLTKIF